MSRPRKPVLWKGVLLRLSLCWAMTVGALTACDALVGGECVAGFQAHDGQCVEIGAGGSGGSGVPLMCDEPLVACPDGCVDLSSNIYNCGKCEYYCITELCEEGLCAGEVVGHSVVIGMSYAQATQPMARLLGNAVFLPFGNPLEILVYKEHADEAAVIRVDEILIAEAENRGREFNLTAAQADGLAESLGSGDYQLVLIHDQSAAPAGVLETLGGQLNTVLNNFNMNGGTVVTLASSAGTGEMDDLMRTAAILDLSGFENITGETVHNRVPGDVIALGVASPFRAKPTTVTFVDVEPPSPTVTHVFSNKDDSAPVVVHKLL